MISADPASDSAADPAAEGRRRAEELLSLLTDDDTTGVERLLEAVTEVRDLVFTGAGLTAIARAEVRTLPPAQRAQANTRQERLGFLRDANAAEPEGLRIWLRRAAEEILLIRTQQAVANRVIAADQAWTATRAAAEASGTAAASSAATTT
ncbi:MAG: uncharacterized protein JWQ45_281 [Blastococcus sp.]|nr:uncharacterized protein [Blastococcus sp.]